MIRLPGLEVLVRMFFIGAGLTILAAVVNPLLCVVSHRRWRSGVPAIWPCRIAFGGAVWGLLWAILDFGGLSRVTAFGPLVLCAAGFAYIASGNRRRGHTNPGLLVPGVWAAALSVAALLATGFGIRMYAAAEAAADAARRAEGGRAQDSFHAVAALGDDTIAVAGTTSSEPSEGDDVWFFVLAGDGRLVETSTLRLPGDQAGLALAPGGGGWWLLGGRDGDRPFRVRAAAAVFDQHRRWDMPGALSALHALGDGRFLAGGHAGEAAWVGVIDSGGSEIWRSELSTGVPDAQVGSVAVAGGRYIAAGSDRLFSRGAFLAGGSLDGGGGWIKSFEGDSSGTIALVRVRTRPDGTFVALGHRSRPGELEDLWLLHVSPEGTVLSEVPLGGPSGELAGGLALRGDEAIVAAYRPNGAGSELWLLAVGLQGSVIWERSFPAVGFGRPEDVAVLDNGEIIVVGSRSLDSKRDAWAARFGRDGTPVWQRTYPASTPAGNDAPERSR
ncbi:MAG TPA: hypothetical protein VJV23_02470 [Candidatus Polarisedimenticolia bacterium]|nr:hypothetical protein [Candidatus Polarisedimenticolia bacterium]